MRLSLFTSAFVATIVGFGGSFAILLAAAEALNASPAETTSWITASYIATGVTALYLSLRHKLPIITAWSTPGAVLIASASATPSMEIAVGTFICTAALIFITAFVKPIERLINAIPTPVAAAMLAGVLMKLVLGLFPAFAAQPVLIAVVVVVFFASRLFTPSMAVVLALAVGLGLSLMLGVSQPLNGMLEMSSLTFIKPVFDWNSMIGLGIPLFIVTMTAQNIAGVAVMKNDGYEVSTKSALSSTGLVSAVTALFGAHTCNLSAITASICTGSDTHPDKDLRWKVGPIYAGFNFLFAFFGASLVALFAAMPSALIAAIAGLALLGPLTGAASNALSHKPSQFAAIATLSVTLSGIELFAISSAFWGLLTGLVLLGLDRLRKR